MSRGGEPITAEHAESGDNPRKAWIFYLCGLCALRGEIAEIFVWAKTKPQKELLEQAVRCSKVQLQAAHHSKEPVFLSGFNVAMGSSITIDDPVEI